MKGHRVTEIVKEIKFEGVWGQGRSKKVLLETSEKFLLLFMSLVTALIHKKTVIFRLQYTSSF